MTTDATTTTTRRNDGEESPARDDARDARPTATQARRASAFAPNVKRSASRTRLGREEGESGAWARGGGRARREGDGEARERGRRGRDEDGVEARKERRGERRGGEEEVEAVGGGGWGRGKRRAG